MYIYAAYLYGIFIYSLIKFVRIVYLYVYIYACIYIREPSLEAVEKNLCRKKIAKDKKKKMNKPI